MCIGAKSNRRPPPPLACRLFQGALNVGAGSSHPGGPGAGGRRVKVSPSHVYIAHFIDQQQQQQRLAFLQQQLSRPAVAGGVTDVPGDAAGKPADSAKADGDAAQQQHVVQLQHMQGLLALGSMPTALSFSSSGAAPGAFAYPPPHGASVAAVPPSQLAQLAQIQQLQVRGTRALGGFRARG